VKSPPEAQQASALTVTGLLALGVAALSTVSMPAKSLLRDVTLLDLLRGGSLVDLPSLAYTSGLFLIGFAATVLGLVLLIARMD